MMSNAVKYTPDGGNITLTIKEKPNGFSELGCYEFSIEDHGIGMTPEFQKIIVEQKVFALFIQSMNAGSRFQSLA